MQRYTHIICTNTVRQFLFKDHQLALNLESCTKYSAQLFHLGSSIFDKFSCKVIKLCRKARFGVAESVGY